MVRTTRPKSIVIGNNHATRVYRTFEDWEAQQQQDQRTPEERGIRVGSAVMWRHRQNQLIVSDRAMVLAIAGETLTLQVKDAQDRTCEVHVREIVITDDNRPA